MSPARQRNWRFVPRGLFWRVFLAIGVAVLIAATVSFGLFFISSGHNLQRVYGQDYSNLSTQVRQALDEDSMKELQMQFKEEKGATLVVLEGKRAIGKKPPSWVYKKLLRDKKRPPKRNKDDDGDDRRRDSHDFEPMQTRLVHNGSIYRIIILPSQDSLIDIVRPLVVLALIAALTLASSVIAWMFSRPLRKVQSAARQLSTGDTSARVPDSVALRRDSIGELGSDFNHMAGRIQHLLDAQLQLLRDVSHELRTPLARMQVALVLAQDSPDKVGSHLTRIEIEIERLDNLIGSILSLSKVESGAATLNESSFDFRLLLTEIAEDAEFEFANRSISAKVDCEDLTLFGDQQQLCSAIENIVRNAMRYSDDGGEVVLAARRSQDTLELSVRDYGPGVEEEQLPRLFEAFYRAESARSAHSNGGHGVGLAITRSIVALHNGSIRAENANGGGLRIVIKLPTSRLR